MKSATRIRTRGQAFLNSAIDAGHQPTMLLAGTNPLHLAVYGPDVIAAPNLSALIDAYVAMPARPDGLFIPTDRMTARVYPMLAARAESGDRSSGGLVRQ